MNEITTGLDQPGKIEYERLMDVDTVFDQALKDKNIHLITHTLDNLLTIGKTSILCTAKFLYLTEKHWEEFQVNDDFVNVIQDLVGISPISQERYRKVWEMYAQEIVPEKLIPELQGRPMKDQIAISNMLSQGYEPDEDQWRDIVDAGDNSSLLARIRDIKGVEPKKDSLQLFLKRNGDLYAFQNGQKTFLGFLDKHANEKAVTRIVRSSGIIEE